MGNLNFPTPDETFWNEGEDEQVDVIISALEERIKSVSRCSPLVQAQYIYDTLYDLSDSESEA